MDSSLARSARSALHPLALRMRLTWCEDSREQRKKGTVGTVFFSSAVSSSQSESQPSSLPLLLLVLDRESNVERKREREEVEEREVRGE